MKSKEKIIEVMKLKKVIVFSTPTCSWCRRLKNYINVDVSRDAKAAQDMIRKTRKQGVPQMWINNVPVVGFDKQKIDRLLEIH